VIILPELHVQLLGDFRLTYDDKPLTTVVHARQQALLAYLLLHRGAPQSRHHLAFLFWPDTDETQALTNLRNLLHKLRRALPDSENFLQVGTQTIQWHPRVRCILDVTDFLALAQSPSQADLRQAVTFYRGDLLPSCYDEWILPERERLQRVLFDILEKLVVQLESTRQYGEAIGYAQQLFRHDPLSEDTYRRLMQLHALNGDRASVMHVYHTCVTTLQRELRVEPGPPTQQLYERLLNFQPLQSPRHVQATAIPLVGREREWAQLREIWDKSAARRPHLILIKGEAGIGKTRLAEELAEWVSRQGFPSLTAHCYSAPGQLAYAPLVECLQNNPPKRLDDIWLIELARLLPELLITHPQLPNPTPLTQDWQRLRLFKALTYALFMGQSSLLLHFEDLQWCDPDTLGWLHYVLQSHMAANSKERLLVVASVRTEETLSTPALESLLAELRRADQLTEIELSPLNEATTLLLASRFAGHELDPAVGSQLFQESEGNPLFVVEMVRAGQAPMGAGVRDDSKAIMQKVQSLPFKVRQVIDARLGQLSPSAQDMVNVAASIGRAFTFDVLKHASRVDEETLMSDLDEMWRRRIIREQGANAYDFSHQKIREVAYSAMSLTRRKMLHTRIAQAMEIVYGAALDSVSGQIAMHYELAGLLGQAIPFYERAANAAHQIYANADAIRDYRRAITLSEAAAGFPASHAAMLQERLGDILHWVGQYEESRAVFRQALALVSSSESIWRARLQRKTGNSWRDEHRYQEALKVYQEAALGLGEAPAEESAPWWREWIQISLEMNLVYYWLGLLEESDELRLKLQPAVEQYSTPTQRAAYFQSIQYIEFRRNHSVGTVEMVLLSRAVLAANQEADNQAAIPAAQYGVGFSLLWNGEPEAAIEPMRTALHLAERTGDVSLQARCLAYLAIAQRQCNRREETRQCAKLGFEVAKLAHMPEYMAMARANQAWLAWPDDPQTAQKFADEALEFWRQLPAGHASAPFQWLARWLLIAAALNQNHLALAIEHARALLDPSQQQLPETLVSCLEQVIQAWDGGLLDTAGTLLQESLMLAQQMHYL
jgi:DNA-binding SARP family transcriptional activator/tetratricopeptide (TPR) repeat protein